MLSSSLAVAVERAAGHSPNVAMAHYVVNRYVGLGANASMEAANILRVCAAWQAWLGFKGPEKIEELKDAVKNEHVLKINGNPYDLVLAGEKIYGPNFKFRDGQERLMNTIYNSNSKVIPIQALPGYGKTSLFQIPMVAIKKRHPMKKVVHFVFVPFISLMANMKERLSKYGALKAHYFSDIACCGHVVSEYDMVADVYVCSYEDVTSPILVSMLNNWGFHFPDTLLGYIVIDEAHHLGRQSFRSNVTMCFAG